MKKIVLLLLISPFVTISQQADITINKEITRIAFGSCSKQDEPDRQLWTEVNNTNPDLWIWLGDNIYGDTEDMQVMREKYDIQKSHSGYQKLIGQTEIIGIWDDHDYGVNDGGKEYTAKDESKEELFAFLEVDKNHPARKRAGAYQSYTYQSREGRIKVILLDARYFRDSLKWNNPGTSQKESIINEAGDILGEKQWIWLASQLSEEDVDLFILGSGIQIIPEEHRWEKWANFPEARKRLFDLIAKRVTAPLVMLSGDRHLSEVSKMEVPGYKYPLWEFTSSSLTSPSGISQEENSYLVKEKIYEPNFALMTILWLGGKPMINLDYFGAEGKELADYTIQF